MTDLPAIRRQATIDIRDGMPFDQFDRLYPELRDEKGTFDLYNTDVLDGMPQVQDHEFFPELFPEQVKKAEELKLLQAKEDDKNILNVVGEKIEHVGTGIKEAIGDKREPGEALLPTAGKFLRNLPGGIVEIVGEVTNLLGSPIETYHTIKDLGTGYLDKIVKPALEYATGETLEPLEQQQMADQLNEAIVENFGTIDKAITTLTNHPEDALLIFSQLSRGAAKLSKLNKLDKTASAFTKVAEVTDPLNIAAKTVKLGARGTKLALKGAGAVAAEGLGKLTGVGAEGIRAAFEFGGKTTFGKALTGALGDTEILNFAKKGFEIMKEQKRVLYGKGYKILEDSKKIFDLEKVQEELLNELQAARVEIGGNGKLDFSKSTITKKPSQAELQEIFNDMFTWDDFTAVGMDVLKQRVQDRWLGTAETAKADRIGGIIGRGIKNEIVAEISEYAEMTKSYEKAMDVIRDIERTLALGDKSTKMTAITRLNQTLRDNLSFRKEALDLLEEASGIQLKPALAGAAMNPIMPRGLAGVIGGGVFGYGAISSMMTPGMIAGLLASSPRVIGMIARTIGIPVERMKQGLEVLKKIGEEAAEKVKKGLVPEETTFKTSIEGGEGVFKLSDEGNMVQQSMDAAGIKVGDVVEYEKALEFGKKGKVETVVAGLARNNGQKTVLLESGDVIKLVDVEGGAVGPAGVVPTGGVELFNIGADLEAASTANSIKNFAIELTVAAKSPEEIKFAVKTINKKIDKLKKVGDTESVETLERFKHELGGDNPLTIKQQKAELEELAANSETIEEFQKAVSANSDKYVDELNRVQQTISKASSSRLVGPTDRIFEAVKLKGAEGGTSFKEAGNAQKSLLEEAKKFDSAEEFVKDLYSPRGIGYRNPKILWRGDGNNIHSQLSLDAMSKATVKGDTKSFSRDRLEASDYGKASPYLVDENIKILDDTQEMVKIMVKNKEGRYGVKTVEEIKNRDFDAYKVGADEIVLLNTDKVKKVSKDQLTDIFNQAKKGKAPGKAKDLYHGTNKVFDTFDEAKLGTQGGQSGLGKGFYFFEEEGAAQGFAKSLTKDKGGAANVKKVTVDGKVFDVDGPLPSDISKLAEQRAVFDTAEEFLSKNPVAEQEILEELGYVGRTRLQDGKRITAIFDTKSIKTGKAPSKSGASTPLESLNRKDYNKFLKTKIEALPKPKEGEVMIIQSGEGRFVDTDVAAAVNRGVNESTKVSIIEESLLELPEAGRAARGERLLPKAGAELEGVDFFHGSKQGNLKSGDGGLFLTGDPLIAEEFGSNVQKLRMNKPKKLFTADRQDNVLEKFKNEIPEAKKLLADEDMGLNEWFTKADKVIARYLREQGYDAIKYLDGEVRGIPGEEIVILDDALIIKGK